MWQGPIDNGPGPDRPKTQWGEPYTYTFTVPEGWFATATPSFQTTWVSYIYFVSGAQGGNVFAELSNDGDPTFVEGLRGEVTILNYHKVNVSPGEEGPGDTFTQGFLNPPPPFPDLRPGDNVSHDLRIGFNDGHGPVDNAAVDISFIYVEPIFRPV